MPLISMLTAPLAAVVSLTSRATILAPSVSPTKTIPSGPMASAPADLRSTLPVCMFSPAAKERAAQHKPATNRDVMLTESLQMEEVGINAITKGRIGIAHGI